MGSAAATLPAAITRRLGNGCGPGSFPLRQIWEALTEAGRRNEAQLKARGHALPGVAAECLRRLAAEPRVIQSTLTGNVEANTRVKLRAFGLDPWIDFSVGGYGVLHERPLLVPVAQYRAAARYGFDPRAETTVLIGDTPADVDAALTGGARVLAVARPGHLHRRRPTLNPPRRADNGQPDSWSSRTLIELSAVRSAPPLK